VLLRNRAARLCATRAPGSERMLQSLVTPRRSPVQNMHDRRALAHEDRKRQKNRFSEGSGASATPSFFCRLVKEVVYWNTALRIDLAVRVLRHRVPPSDQVRRQGFFAIMLEKNVSAHGARNS
jgi:hypothetical protein